MKLRAEFLTLLRGQSLRCKINGDFNPPERVVLRIEFREPGLRKGRTWFTFADLTREELARLCREAAAAARRKQLDS